MLGEDFSKRAVEFSPNARLAIAIPSIIISLLVLGFLFFFALIAALISPFIPFLVLALGVALVAFEYWYYGEFLKKFAFELRNDHFFSRKGVFKASYTMLRYERIQDIHINQSIFEMLLGLWNVSIFTATATGRGSENIPGLSKDSAEAFKTALFQKIKRVRKVVD
ncbi:MAG: PH domain-containing protein [Candidatus Micrarchaeota archaeon]